MKTQDSFLVLGAGPTGLAVAKALKEKGIPYIQAEATDHVGGNWAHGVYETAHIISSKRTTEYPDYPMPASYPDFPSALQMKTYMEDYARHFGLFENIRFQHEVTSIRPRPDELWEIRFENQTTEIYKGVLICNGHHWKRSFPAWVQQYQGEVIHSKDYKDPEQLRKKRVLVLGGGNSGCDVISEAARVGTAAEWSLRRGYWFMPKTFFGIPSVEMINPWLPIAFQRLMIRTLLSIVVGKYETYGLPTPDHKIFEAHPTVSTEIFHYLKHGRITPRPDIQRAEGKEVVFADGSRQTYDLVVCATGFDVAFPFLPEGMIPIKGKIPQLIAGLLRPEYRHLYIVGAYQARYGIGPLLRPLAVLLAEWLPLQDDISIPLGRLLADLGQKPPTTHLLDPHESLRRLRLGRRLLPFLRFQARRKGVLRSIAAAV